MLTDAVGSTIALTDPNGGAQNQYTYEPFGLVSGSRTISNPLQYTGRENDGTGLLYYRARYYAPALHRFIAEDPIGLASGDPNLYGYVGNNPLSYADPFGLCFDPGGPGPRYCIDSFVAEATVRGIGLAPVW